MKRMRQRQTISLILRALADTLPKQHLFFAQLRMGLKLLLLTIKEFTPSLTAMNRAPFSGKYISGKVIENPANKSRGKTRIMKSNLYDEKPEITYHMYQDFLNGPIFPLAK